MKQVKQLNWWQRNIVQPLIKRGFFNKKEEVKTIGIQRVSTPKTASTLKVYQTDVIISINGHHVGKFPLKVLATGKNDVGIILRDKSSLVATNVKLVHKKPPINGNPA